ncbi:MAG TPA: substrate-binding domain-containing protein [Gemmataceae bacterium]|nr:substrate-binding domain-containing protein [Gemmataceae bacterium]
MRRLALTLVFAAAWLTAGCHQGADPSGNKGTAPPSGAGKRGTLGVSVLTLTNPFFKVIADTITAEAAKHGYDVLIVSGEEDVATQHNQVKDFIVKKVSAMVLCPCNSKGIGPAIQEANEAGIPVFTADIACLAKGPKVVSHIATDNYSGGKEAAKAMIEALGENGGKIVILDYQPAESCLLRVDGFKKVLDAYNKDRKTGNIIIVAELPGDGKKDKGHKVAKDALTTHPDLAGIFAINDPSALGARVAVEEAGRADQVKIIGFDGQPEGKEAIREGKIYADPVQFPDEIGVKTVNAIVRHFKGEPVEPEILIPTRLYRQADALKELKP